MKSKKLASLLITMTFLVIAYLMSGRELMPGEVVSVSDGDTLRVMHEGEEIKVRLYGIDTPERAQKFGEAAHDRATELALGMTVSLTVMDTDRYGRTVAIVYLPDGESLNARMVQDGLAWHYVKYAPDALDLALFEAEARAANRGLWADPAPTPPWEFRAQDRKLSP